MFGKALWLISFLVLADQALAAPPKDLFGKSITVSWSETREQKWPGEAQFQKVPRAGEVIIYVSSAGRVFNRMSFSGSRRGGKMVGNSDQVAGAGSDKYENRVVNFQSRSLSMHTPMAGGARSVTVDFSEGFGSCTAAVITGKSAGAGKMVMKSLMDNGMEFEIRSVTTGAANCSISEGNKFGG